MAKRGRGAKRAKAGRSLRAVRGGAGGIPRFWGRHAIEAAINNPDRTVRKLFGTRDAITRLAPDEDIPVQFCEAADLAMLVPSDAPHQGIVADVEPLEDIFLADALIAAPDAPVLILDQVTDPHNIGAILRSAAAFGVKVLITQDRHTPSESGVIAKAASGALERVHWVRVVNLSRALDELSEAGYWRIAMDGDSETLFADALPAGPVALVLGAEGEGIRHNVAQHCDNIARLPISSDMESLNVSNAAAVALYAVATHK